MLTKATMVDGNYDIGIMPTGVGLGVIKSAPKVSEIVEEIMAEATLCLRALTESKEIDYSKLKRVLDVWQPKWIRDKYFNGRENTNHGPKK